MKGKLNSVHKIPKSKLKEIREKQSRTMKKLITDGKFTPAITNSWANSRTRINIKNTEYLFRSTWEAIFWLLNKNLKYEETRILYTDNYNVLRNYIIDFTDEENKILYEIKPIRQMDSQLNKIKFEAAREWVKNNNYKFIIIDDVYFKENAKKINEEFLPKNIRIQIDRFNNEN